MPKLGDPDELVPASSIQNGARIALPKEEWIRRYGGQELLDAEKFEVIPCACDDRACRGWQVIRQYLPRLVQIEDVECIERVTETFPHA